MQDFGKKKRGNRGKSRKSKTVIKIGGGRRRGYGRRYGGYRRSDPIVTSMFFMMMLLMVAIVIVKKPMEGFSMPEFDMKWLGFGENKTEKKIVSEEEVTEGFGGSSKKLPILNRK